LQLDVCSVLNNCGGMAGMPLIRHTGALCSEGCIDLEQCRLDAMVCAPEDAVPPPAGSEEGCGCRAPGTEGRGLGWVAILAGLAILATAIRRRCGTC
jgi:hypothetical protein